MPIEYADMTTATAINPLFTIFIDGDCPLCRKEGKLMERIDGGRGRLRLIDITATDFDPGVYDRTFDEFMGEIHGLAPDGSLITGMEVFRRSYAAIGWGWLLGWTKYTPFRQVSDACYRFFAKHRLKLTFRKDACETGRCAVRP